MRMVEIKCVFSISITTWNGNFFFDKPMWIDLEFFITNYLEMWNRRSTVKKIQLSDVDKHLNKSPMKKAVIKKKSEKMKILWNELIVANDLIITTDFSSFFFFSFFITNMLPFYYSFVNNSLFAPFNGAVIAQALPYPFLRAIKSKRNTHKKRRKRRKLFNFKR